MTADQDSKKLIFASSRAKAGIPYDKVSNRPGAHRRVKLSDVLHYQESRRPVRRRVLRELTQEAVEAGSYGEPAPED